MSSHFKATTRNVAIQLQGKNKFENLNFGEWVDIRIAFHNFSQSQWNDPRKQHQIFCNSCSRTLVWTILWITKIEFVNTRSRRHTNERLNLQKISECLDSIF